MPLTHLLAKKANSYRFIVYRLSFIVIVYRLSFIEHKSAIGRLSNTFILSMIHGANDVESMDASVSGSAAARNKIRCPSQKLIRGKLIKIRLSLHSDRKQLPDFRLIEIDASKMNFLIETDSGHRSATRVRCF